MGKFLMYVGSSAAAQTKVSDSPAFGTMAPPTVERKSIMLLTNEGGKLAIAGEVDTGTHIGWIQHHPTNGHLYAVGGGRVRAYRVVGPSGLVEEFSSADALGNPAHFELSLDGAWALVANYSASTIAVLPILADGRQ